MSNGWLIAAAADASVGAELAAGFGLELIHPGPPDEREALLAPLVNAPNLGVLLTPEAAHDDAFVALIRMLTGRRPNAQLIVANQHVRSAFPFIPDTWPLLLLDEAKRRARLALERRGGAPTQQQPPQPQYQTPPPPPPEPVVEPPMPAPEPPPIVAEPEPIAPEPTHVEEPTAAEPPPIVADNEGEALSDIEPSASESFGGGAPPLDDAETHDIRGEQIEEAKRVAEQEHETHKSAVDRHLEDLRRERERHQLDSAEERVEPPVAAPAPAAPPAEEVASAPPLSRMDDALRDGAPPPPQSAPAPAAKRSAPVGAAMRRGPDETAPADATAFAPRKLRRGEAELVRVAIHQPKDLKEVIKAARKADPRTDAAPQSMGIGEVAIGAKVGVSLEVKGGACDGELQRRTWNGDPLDFSFPVTADADVKQVVILARVFVDDAQIGVLAFTRGVVGPRAKPLSDGDKVRLKRHKRVFLSYSSKDRETVSAIATAYEAAGVAHFWDRTSLKSGEEWHPRLRREIDRCDLFHLCWSKSAAESAWVEKEASHALGMRRRKKKPDITVQMLDGPPWAKHPDSLDAINFDDFVRAAIVGYARGDGS
jgi:hypothetical protein